MTPQPSHPAQPSTSSASSTPARAANGASSVNTSAARAAVVRACTQVATRKPSAPAKRPVTSSAAHTVAPRGASSWPERDRHEEADERRRHLQERQRARVVAGSEALESHDLQRRGERAREDEGVAERRPAGRAVQEQEADHRERDPGPERAPAPASGRARAR